MESIRIAAVQMNARFGRVEENLAKIEAYSRQAASQGVELALFPELCITGHWCDGKAWSFAEPVPEGPSAQRLVALGRELKMFISAGLGENDRGVTFNTQVVVGPEGFVGKARKIHPSGNEYFYFRGGTEMPVFDLGKCRVGISICFDGTFPEHCRILAVKGAEVILMPHAARYGKSRKRGHARLIAHEKYLWTKMYTGRACDNGVFCVVVNQAGEAGPDTAHAGGMLIFDPNGNIIAESKTKKIEEEMLVLDLDGEMVNKRRQEPCFNLLVRRPEVYGDLTKLF